MKSKKTILLVAVIGIALLLICETLLGLALVIGGKFGAIKNEEAYFAPYREKAMEYLIENEEFSEKFGKVETDFQSYNYRYNTDKYRDYGIFKAIPETRQDFESAIVYMEFVFSARGTGRCTVLFEKDDLGQLTITDCTFEE